MRRTNIFDDLDEAISNVLPILTKLLIQLWNHAMRLLVAVGIMPVFRKQPWMFAVVIFVLLAVFVPIGVLCVLCAFAALGKAKAENDFIVDQTEPEGEQL